ncbi:MAG: biotin--[acetyl-CoA-carboxylase] ligase [Flavobacteriaceae bacterium]|jgi:BirA family biotin operon repressor/biotin-[acetyl-CoA-carboxylase] ligase|tara:strand:- start:310 stop:1035 length:726 start_codon:yes stop_codon:yes gene_type:complete
MHIIKLDAIDSTNDSLRKLILEKKPTTPTVVVSQYQKKGKGQRGQVWISQAGKNLMFSLYMPNFTLPTRRVFSINKIVSACLLHWLSSFQIPNICVKWPNDILSGDSKLAGILIESNVLQSTVNSIIIGVGLNVNQVEFQNLPNATSMQLLTGKNYDIDTLLLSLMTRLIESLTPPLKNCNDDYHKYLYGLGQSRLFLKDNKTFEGIIQSVNSEGKLVLETTAGMQVFDVKELQFVHVADQ